MIDWNKLDWGDPADFSGFERDESLDLKQLDFKHYIWLRFFEDIVLSIGDEEGFWQMCEEESEYASPEVWLRRMLTGDMFLKVRRDTTGYKRIETIE